VHEAAYFHYPHRSNQRGEPSGAIRVGNYKLVNFFKDIYSLQTAWLIVMYSIVACAVVAAVLLATMWKLRPKA
jgi:hypothetical protein